MTAVVFLRVRSLDIGVRHDAIAPDTAEVVERVPSLVGVLVEEGLHPGKKAFDHVGSDGVIEHCGRADLRRAAPEQEIVQRMGEIRYAADPGETLRRERRGHLRDLGQRQWQDRRAAQAAV
jgi:hypothetical protein